MIDIVKSTDQSQYDDFQLVEVVFLNGNTRFLVNSLLPTFWTIVQAPNARIHTDPDRKRIVIPNPYLNQSGNMFSLFHEIGHGIVDDTKNEMEIEEEIFLRDKYSQLGPNSLSAMEKNRFRMLVVDSEKEAWKWALKTITNCRDRGLDLEPSLTKNDLKKLANQKLASYLR